LQDDCVILSSKENENDLDTKDMNDHSENTESWIDCVGKLSSLVQIIKECKILLKKVHADDIPNPIYFLTMSIELISSVKEKSAMYIQSASNVLSKEFTSEKSFFTNEEVVDKLLDHDPGKRGKVESASQRNYLLSLGPYQPLDYTFPTNYDITKGKQRQFNSSWFKEYPHLEYSICYDAAFCFICSLFPNGPNRARAENSWTVDGVRNWSKMKSRGKGKPGKLELHFSSNTHKSALVDFSNFTLNCNHIDKLLNKENRQAAIQISAQKQFHKDVIKILFDVTRTLARQGLSFRGDGDENNGNFKQIILLLSRYCPTMKTWLEETAFRPYHVTYMSHDSQNEFIHLLAKETKKKIVSEVKKAQMYSVMADTTPDLSNRDQMSVCVRYVDTKSKVCERLIEITETQDKTGKGNNIFLYLFS